MVTGAGGDLDGFAAARLGIERLAFLLERGIDGRRLLDVAAPDVQRGFDGRRVQRRHGRLLDDLPDDVVGVGGRAERDFRHVRLGVSLIVFHKSGGLAQTEHQHAARKGVERAGVTDAALTAPATDALDHIVAGEEPFGVLAGGCLSNPGLSTTSRPCQGESAGLRRGMGLLLGLLLFKLASAGRLHGRDDAAGSPRPLRR